jgi:carbonic anhydrase
MSRIATLCLALAFLATLPACKTNERAAGIAKGEARAELMEGNGRFRNGDLQSHRWSDERVVKTGTFGQSPSVGVLSCADSRVPVELVFDQGVGDLFVVRVAGNSESDTAAGTFEYGVSALGVHTILVLGHTKCGAVEAAFKDMDLPGNMGSFTQVIRPALDKASPDNLDAAVEANVRWQQKQLLARSEILRQAVADGKLDLLMGVYDVETGQVRFID